jgi:hypothetical protein
MTEMTSVGSSLGEPPSRERAERLIVCSNLSASNHVLCAFLWGMPGRHCARSALMALIIEAEERLMSNVKLFTNALFSMCQMLLTTLNARDTVVSAHTSTAARLVLPGHHDVGLSYSLHCVYMLPSIAARRHLLCIALMYETSGSLAQAHRPPYVAERTSRTSCWEKDQRQKVRVTPLKQCCAK